MRQLPRFLCVFLFLIPSVSLAGAWLQPEGKGQWIAQSSYYTNNEFFDANGARTNQDRFTKYELQPYVEYGLTPLLTVGASAYLQQVSQSGENNYGIADPEIFSRSVLWKSDHEVLSLQPLIKFKSRFADEGVPRGGSRSTDIELSLLYGRSVHWLSNNDFIDLRGGYRYRANRLNDQWRFDAMAGIEVAPDWLILPAVRAIISTDLQDKTTFSENGDQDFDLYKAELGIGYRMGPDRMLTATGFTHVYGAQTGNGLGIILSVMQNF